MIHLTNHNQTTYSHISTCSVIIRETSSYSRWEQIQRPIARYYAQRRGDPETHSSEVSPSNLSLQSSGNLIKEDIGKKMKELEGMEDTSKTRPLKPQDPQS